MPGEHPPLLSAVTFRNGTDAGKVLYTVGGVLTSGAIHVYAPQERAERLHVADGRSAFLYSMAFSTAREKVAMLTSSLALPANRPKEGIVRATTE